MEAEVPVTPMINNLELTEEEATQLANELSLKLSDGETPEVDQELLQRMVAGLGDKRGALRLTFAKSLGAIGEGALPILCYALRNHENVVVRRASAKTLNLIGSKEALPFLLEAFLNDEDPVVLGSSAGAMATIGPDAMEDLFKILMNPDSTAFQVGLVNLALSFIGSKAPEAMLRAADAAHAEVRVAAIAALGEQIQTLGDTRAKAKLIQALEDEDGEVRAEAATLVGKSYDAEDVQDLLVKRLADTNNQVRKNAALSLMKLGAIESIDALTNAEDQESEEDVKKVLNVAIQILKRDAD